MNAFAMAGGGWWLSLLSQLLAFLLLGVVLGIWVVPFLRRLLERRSQEIRERFDALEREARETAEHVGDLTRRLRSIGEESAQRLRAAAEEGQRTRDQILAEARAQVEAEIEKARRTIRIERDKAVLELREEVARLAVGAAERAVDRLSNESLHRRLVDRYVEELEGAGRAP